MIISTKQKLAVLKSVIKIYTVFNALNILESMLIMLLIGKNIFKKFKNDFSVSWADELHMPKDFYL